MSLRLRGRRLVVIAVVAQLPGAGVAEVTGTGWVYAVGLAVSALAALAFCARNLRVTGVPLVTAGLLLNAVVVGANAAMPVSIAAAARAGVSIDQIAAGNDPRHEIAGAGTHLRPLGDVIPAPLPVLPEVASPGDLLIAAGLAELVVLAMRRPRRRRYDAVSPSDTRLVGRPEAAPEVARRTDGEEGPQAPRPREAQGQPRQAPERLIRY